MNNMHISPRASLQGAEIELAVIDTERAPVFSIEGSTPIRFLKKAFKDDARWKRLHVLGNVQEEVFRHQLEVVTKTCQTQDLIAVTLEMFDIIVDILQELGLKASSEQPVAVDMYGLDSVITPGPYYLPSMKKVDQHFMDHSTMREKYFGPAVTFSRAEDGITQGVAWNASTTAIHVHNSFADNTATLKAHTALCRMFSDEIRSNPRRYLDHCMSQQRYTSWRQIVAIRNAIGETLGGMTDPIIEQGTPREAFILDRYFPGLSMQEVLSMNHHLARDHRGQALKQKGGSFTTESRMADGPGMSRTKLKEALHHNNENIAKALTMYQ